MATELRRWLTKQPRPALVVGTDENGTEHKVKISEQRGRWKDAEAILSRCVTLEAFAEDGTSIRVCDLAGDGGAPTEHKAQSKEEHTLAVFARLLAEAYTNGAKSNEDAYRLGFEQQREVLGLVQSRLAVLEQAWHRLLMAQQPPGDGDPNAPLVAMVLAQAFGMNPEAMRAAAAATTVGATVAPKAKPTNGKK